MSVPCILGLEWGRVVGRSIFCATVRGERKEVRGLVVGDFFFGVAGDCICRGRAVEVVAGVFFARFRIGVRRGGQGG